MKLENLSRLSEHIYIHHSVINVGFLTHNNRALLIDFGDGSVLSALDALGITGVESVLFTHHHRDQASGIDLLSNKGVKLGIPAEESPWFLQVEKFWSDLNARWHIYNVHPHSLMLAESLPEDGFEIRCHRQGDIIEWGEARISVLDTPGHTDGSISYVVEADSSVFAFCGDVIYDKGQIWELYSMQKKGETSTDYHGFLGSRKQLRESLLKLRAAESDALIPSHGNVMQEPIEAIDVLIERLDNCYDKYVAISALRHYFPGMFTEFEGRDGHMPIRSGKHTPEFLRHYGTTWLVISQTGEAFALDCGNANVVKRVKELQESGEISGVAGLWITHYHDDHVDAIPQFQETFGCPVYADRSVAEVVENPRGFRTPCISPVAVQVDHHTEDGESWTWNEFRMTAYHFPGQTYYHGGLLIEGRGARMFFAGDSFTMSGIDDYCSGNRNWLGRGVGFDRCLKLMQDLKPTHIFNCHVDTAFDFTDQELQFMRANLSLRGQIYGELFPWDSPNYGMDEHWVRCYPYEQDAGPGETISLRLEITNHSAREQSAACYPILPEAWNKKVDAKSVSIPAKSDGHINFSFTIPRNATPKCTVIPVDITYGGRPLGQFREAILIFHGRR